LHLLFVEEFATWNYIASNEDVLTSYVTAFEDFFNAASGDGWEGIPAGALATPA